ncbi:MAG TPA: hypothetical protein DCP20_09390 [Coriobacteriia bacterium]|nr:MAG: Uncharacterized protein XD74_0020 [Actinobacteria bacterium 66_15]HAL30909.1 hypothetical protein [Coriobacteriia bacterium]
MNDDPNTHTGEAPVVPQQTVQPEAPAEPPPGRTGSRFALWAGVGLILLGGLLLVSQFVPEVGLWRWWPLIVVAVGIRQLFGPVRGGWTLRNLGEGLTTITLGVVLLAQMLGFVRWDVWLSILRLWPALIVALGFELLGKGTRSELVRFMGSLVVIAALVYGAFVMTPTRGWPPVFTSAEATAFDHTAPHVSRIVEGTAEITGAAGDLTVGAGRDLVRVEGRSPFTPEYDVDMDGRAAVVRIGAGEGVWGPMTPASELDVRLDRSVAWDLDVNAGVSGYELDLRDLTLTALELDSGVSDGALILGEPEPGGGDGVPVDIKAGVSALEVRVPRGANARVVMSDGLSGIETEGEWEMQREDGRRIYHSEGFSDRGPFWDIRIESGISGITLSYH